MELIDELRAEHGLIEQVVGSLRTYGGLRARGEGDPSEASRFLLFFQLFAGHFHHAREEDTLFAALHRDAELPLDRGPLAVMLADHRRLAAVLDELGPLLSAVTLDDGRRARLAELVQAYAEGLWHHIDAENSVLLPESEQRLRWQGVRELPSRPMTDEERVAKAAGEALLVRYPPGSELDVMRGDGCIACPAYGVSCAGLEREWWNRSEWEEFPDRATTG